MKSKLLFITIIFCFINNAYGENNNESGRIILQVENLDFGAAGSIGMYTGDILYGGFSLNNIRSSTTIQRHNRDHIYPVYVAIGLRAPWTISPYIEAGVDLGDYIIDGVFDDETDSIDEIDYYFSGGLEISFNKAFSIMVFAKDYTFKFKDDSTPTVINKQRSYGGGLILRF